MQSLSVEHDQREPSEPSTESSIQIARMQAEQKIALHGSIEKWPTMPLEPRRFATCVCDHSRTKSHRMIGTDRGPCTAKDCDCKLFVAMRRER